MEDWNQIFEKHFFDARKYKPQKGQVMAKYTAVAYLEDGRLKRDIIDLLFKQDKAEAAARVMNVLGGAALKDSYRIPKEMAQDLLQGFDIEEVAAKPYKFLLEHLFWATKGMVPDDIHWYTIPVLSWGNLVDQLDFTSENSACQEC